MGTVYDRMRGKAMTTFCSILLGAGEKATALQPAPGDFYDNRNGQTYQCIAPGEEPFSAVMENVKSGWRFTAHRIVVWPDGYIEWGFSTSGRFVR